MGDSQFLDDLHSTILYPEYASHYAPVHKRLELFAGNSAKLCAGAAGGEEMITRSGMDHSQKSMIRTLEVKISTIGQLMETGKLPEDFAGH